MDKDYLPWEIHKREYLNKSEALKKEKELKAQLPEPLPFH